MKVINFGSLNIDHVYSVEHFVKAGETVSSHSLELFPGGKGLNQSIAFSKAGADVFHAGCIGKDGEILLTALKDSGVDTSLVNISQDIPSGHAIIQVNSVGENSILLFGGANMSVSRDFATSAISEFGCGDLIMLQNEINNVGTIARVAKEKGLTVALNPSPFNERISDIDLSLVDWLILNETEGKGISGKENPDDILNSILRDHPHMKTVLTLGTEGSVYADAKKRISHGIFKTHAVDTTAAGDTFTGFFFTSVLKGKSIEEALCIASAASAIAVSRKGASTSIPTLAEVLDFCEKSKV